jgi:hypothetical protein
VINDLIQALGGDAGRLLEVHTVDPNPGTITVQHTSATWVESRSQPDRCPARPNDRPTR